ncbi:MAG TPA: lipid IV(A) 3-deoxy-D-manno-octulosonic acid transferase [Xanthomonadaceae bacterium]|nr:lipid IV(A) 3-deoxy-D-manno-octulosonic acid transferase [Xanthomonadaceae bacterium]
MASDPIERLLRGVYSATLYLLAPITVYHLIWRGFRQRAYFQRWNERYGAYAPSMRPAPLWLHAVSVGEVNAAAPLVDALRAQRPDLRIVITSITPTGSQRVRALWGEAVEHVYLPYDLPGAVARFLDRFHPALAMIVETELWPNLLFACRDRGIPTYIVNARLSARSLHGYRLLRPLIARALRSVCGVLAQSPADAARFLRLGALPERVQAVGNLKFDVTLPADAADCASRLRTAAGARPVWIAASTHEGEEDAMLQIHRQLRARFPALLLLWAPRHPERFGKAVAAARAAGWRLATRSQQGLPNASTDVFLLDSMGELASFYACADVAFIGGSLQAIGGHNLLEAAALGVPIVSGPHLHNFAEVAAGLAAASALRIGADHERIAEHLAALLADADARRTMGEAGRRLVEAGRGALARTLQALTPALPPTNPESTPR